MATFPSPCTAAFIGNIPNSINRKTCGKPDGGCRDAYALRVRGDSMHPRYRAGEFIIVEPGSEPQPQDDVVVVCSDGSKMLKMLNWINAEEAQFLSINNGYAPVTMRLSEIESIQRVAGHAPRSAFIEEKL